MQKLKSLKECPRCGSRNLRTEESGTQEYICCEDCGEEFGSRKRSLRQHRSLDKSGRRPQEESN